MAYEPIEWVNKEDENFVEGESPAIDVENLKHIEDGILNSVCKDGDTMNGSLHLAGEPIDDDEAVPKSYVDNNIQYYKLSVTVPISQSPISSPSDFHYVYTIPDFNYTKYNAFCQIINYSSNSNYYTVYGVNPIIEYGTPTKCDFNNNDLYIKIDTDGKVYCYYYNLYTSTTEAHINLILVLLPVKQIEN